MLAVSVQWILPHAVTLSQGLPQGDPRAVIVSTDLQCVDYYIVKPHVCVS